MSKATKVRFKIEGEEWMDADTWKEAMSFTGVESKHIQKELAKVEETDEPFSVEIEVDGIKFRPESVKRYGKETYKWRFVDGERFSKWAKAVSINDLARQSGNYASTIHRALKSGASSVVIKPKQGRAFEVKRIKHA